MAKQKKIIDINVNRTHIVCIQMLDRTIVNPFRIHMVISAPGSPVRRRLLTKYADPMSVLYFIIQFFREGLDALALSEVLDWIKDHTA